MRPHEPVDVLLLNDALSEKTWPQLIRDKFLAGNILAWCFGKRLCFILPRFVSRKGLDTPFFFNV